MTWVPVCERCISPYCGECQMPVNVPPSGIGPGDTFARRPPPPQPAAAIASESSRPTIRDERSILLPPRATIDDGRGATQRRSIDARKARRVEEDAIAPAHEREDLG